MRKRCAHKQIWRVFFFCLLVLAGHFAAAQENLPDSILKNLQRPELGPNDTIVVAAKIENGELVPARSLTNWYVLGRMPKGMKERLEKWTRLRNAVYVTYPYARKAGLIMNDIN